MAVADFQAQQQNRLRYGQKTHQGFFYIKGKVEDFNGDPIKKASVLLPEIDRSTETDDRGQFTIERIPAGIYHLEVYPEGHISYSSDPFVLKRNLDNTRLP